MDAVNNTCASRGCSICENAQQAAEGRGAESSDAKNDDKKLAWGAIPDADHFTHVHAGSRAQVWQSSGNPQHAGSVLDDSSFDAFVSTYVLDILSEADIASALQLAHRYCLQLCCRPNK